MYARLRDEQQRPRFKWLQRNHFIARYNEVVELFNSKHILPKLIPLKEPEMLVYLYTLYATALGKLALLALLLCVPLVNIFLMCCFLSCVIFVQSQMSIVRRNIKSVPNPFQDFMLDNDLCLKLHKRHTTIKITLQQLEGFTFNQNLQEALMQKAASKNGVVSLTLYDKYTYESYYKFQTGRCRLWFWAIASVVLSAFSLLVYGAIII